MSHTQSVRSGRLLLGLSLAMGASLTVAASLNYLLTPMRADLGLSQDQTSIALAIPSIASLLIVFLAGRLGDRRGHRTVVLWMSVLFIVGSALVMVTPGLAFLVLGLLLAGLAATAIQIVVIGLLSDRFAEPSARARAFGTFGMVSPFIWMLFPVLTGAVVREHSWRLVPAIWVLCGIAMLIGARKLLPPARTVQPLGEIRTPILAGLTVVLGVQALSRISDGGLTSPAFLATVIATVLSALACGIVMHRTRKPSFSLQPLRVRRARGLLAVVIIIPLINTVFFMTLAFQYLYGLSVLQTALIMVPAQAAAILGTRYLAGPLMRRYGVTRTASALFGVLAIAMLGALLMSAGSPLWVPAVYVAVYNVLTVAASITVTSGVMSTGNDENSGLVAAYRGSSVALGGTLAVVVMNAAVFGLSRLWLDADFQQQGMTSSEATTQMNEIMASATSPDVMTQYAVPLPSGATVDQSMQDAIATGLHINGLLGSALSILCVVLIVNSARRARRS